MLTARIPRATGGSPVAGTVAGEARRAIGFLPHRQAAQSSEDRDNVGNDDAGVYKFTNLS